MKLRIGFKTPDAVEYAIKDAIAYIEDEDERYEREHELTELASKFIRYGEVITIELDTKSGEARIVPVST